jgi:ABC-2 type transport system permease protein
MSRTGNIGESVRIILAIVIKDIVDGIKNRNTISILATAIFIILFYRFVSTIRLGNGLPNVIVYDAGFSSLAEQLDQNRNLNFYIFRSQAVMEEKLTKMGDAREIGLVIPMGIDSVLEGSQNLELDGYVLHWATDKDVEETIAAVEGEIATLVDRPVRIVLEGNVVYAQTDSFGHPFVTSIGLVFVILMIGAIFTPNLMLEEKRTKAIDALMVSPASSSQIVIGKAISGTFYCLLGAALVLLINSSLVVHWELLLLTLVVGMFFCVVLGLFLGTLFETRQQLTLWGFLLLQPLGIPMFLLILTEILPNWVVTAFGFIPTVAFMRVVRLSFTESVAFSSWGGQTALILGYGLALSIGIVWLIRRSDR